MGTKNNVFASRSERDNFYKLCRVWGDKYRIYHNLPFLNVFDTKNLVDRSDQKNPKPFELNDLEIARLKKTSIDYTLCDEKDAPIVCIEFDGLQQGINEVTKEQLTKVKSTPGFLSGMKISYAESRIRQLQAEIAQLEKAASFSV